MDASNVEDKSPAEGLRLGTLQLAALVCRANRLSEDDKEQGGCQKLTVLEVLNSKRLIGQPVVDPAGAEGFMGLGGICHVDGRFWMTYRDPRVAEMLLKNHAITLKAFTDVANSQAVGYNIDLCSTCGCSGLRLYLCDACPAAFHSSCAGCRAQELQRAGPAFCRPCRKDLLELHLKTVCVSDNSVALVMPQCIADVLQHAQAAAVVPDGPDAGASQHATGSSLEVDQLIVVRESPHWMTPDMEAPVAPRVNSSAAAAAAAGPSSASEPTQVATGYVMWQHAVPEGLHVQLSGQRVSRSLRDAGGGARRHAKKGAAANSGGGSGDGGSSGGLLDLRDPGVWLQPMSWRMLRVDGKLCMVCEAVRLASPVLYSAGVQLSPHLEAVPLPGTWLQRHYCSERTASQAMPSPARGAEQQQPAAPVEGTSLEVDLDLPSKLTVVLHVLLMDGSGRRQLASSAMFRDVALRPAAGASGAVAAAAGAPAAEGSAIARCLPEAPCDWELHHERLQKEIQSATRGQDYWLSYMKQDSGMLECWLMPVPTAQQLQRPDAVLEDVVRSMRQELASKPPPRAKAEPSRPKSAQGQQQQQAAQARGADAPGQSKRLRPAHDMPATAQQDAAAGASRALTPQTTAPSATQPAKATASKSKAASGGAAPAASGGAAAPSGMTAGMEVASNGAAASSGRRKPQPQEARQVKAEPQPAGTPHQPTQQEDAAMADGAAAPMSHVTAAAGSPAPSVSAIIAAAVAAEALASGSKDCDGACAPVHPAAAAGEFCSIPAAVGLQQGGPGLDGSTVPQRAAKRAKREEAPQQAAACPEEPAGEQPMAWQASLPLGSQRPGIKPGLLRGQLPSSMSLRQRNLRGEPQLDDLPLADVQALTPAPLLPPPQRPQQPRQARQQQEPKQRERPTPQQQAQPPHKRQRQLSSQALRPAAKTPLGRLPRTSAAVPAAVPQSPVAPVSPFSPNAEALVVDALAMLARSSHHAAAGRWPLPGKPGRPDASAGALRQQLGKASAAPASPARHPNAQAALIDRVRRQRLAALRPSKQPAGAVKRNGVRLPGKRQVRLPAALQHDFDVLPMGPSANGHVFTSDLLVAEVEAAGYGEEAWFGGQMGSVEAADAMADDYAMEAVDEGAAARAPARKGPKAQQQHPQHRHLHANAAVASGADASGHPSFAFRVPPTLGAAAAGVMQPVPLIDGRPPPRIVIHKPPPGYRLSTGPRGQEQTAVEVHGRLLHVVSLEPEEQPEEEEEPNMDYETHVASASAQDDVEAQAATACQQQGAGAAVDAAGTAHQHQRKVRNRNHNMLQQQRQQELLQRYQDRMGHDKAQPGLQQHQPAEPPGAAAAGEQSGLMPDFSGAAPYPAGMGASRAVAGATRPGSQAALGKVAAGAAADAPVPLAPVVNLPGYKHLCAAGQQQQHQQGTDAAAAAPAPSAQGQPAGAAAVPAPAVGSGTFELFRFQGMRMPTAYQPSATAPARQSAAATASGGAAGAAMQPARPAARPPAGAPMSLQTAARIVAQKLTAGVLGNAPSPETVAKAMSVLEKAYPNIPRQARDIVLAPPARPVGSIPPVRGKLQGTSLLQGQGRGGAAAPTPAEAAAAAAAFANALTGRPAWPPARAQPTRTAAEAQAAAAAAAQAACVRLPSSPADAGAPAGPTAAAAPVAGIAESAAAAASAQPFSAREHAPAAQPAAPLQDMTAHGAVCAAMYAAVTSSASDGAAPVAGAACVVPASLQSGSPLDPQHPAAPSAGGAGTARADAQDATPPSSSTGTSVGGAAAASWQLLTPSPESADNESVVASVESCQDLRVKAMRQQHMQRAQQQWSPEHPATQQAMQVQTAAHRPVQTACTAAAAVTLPPQLPEPTLFCQEAPLDEPEIHESHGWDAGAQAGTGAGVHGLGQAWDSGAGAGAVPMEAEGPGAEAAAAAMAVATPAAAAAAVPAAEEELPSPRDFLRQEPLFPEEAVGAPAAESQPMASAAPAPASETGVPAGPSQRDTQQQAQAAAAGMLPLSTSPPDAPAAQQPCVGVGAPSQSANAAAAAPAAAAAVGRPSSSAAMAAAALASGALATANPAGALDSRARVFALVGELTAMGHCGLPLSRLCRGVTGISHRLADLLRSQFALARQVQEQQARGRAAAAAAPEAGAGAAVPVVPPPVTQGVDALPVPLQRTLYRASLALHAWAQHCAALCAKMEALQQHQKKQQVAAAAAAVAAGGEVQPVALHPQVQQQQAVVAAGEQKLRQTLEEYVVQLLEASAVLFV